jgi:hypothetical protein
LVIFSVFIFFLAAILSFLLQFSLYFIEYKMNFQWDYTVYWF